MFLTFVTTYVSITNATTTTTTTTTTTIFFRAGIVSRFAKNATSNKYKNIQKYVNKTKHI
jgi:hypothetical protein